MSAVDTVSLFLGVLAVVAQITTIALAAIAIASRFSSGAATLRRRIGAELGIRAIGLGAVVAAFCVAVTLYYSEVADFPPCRLCWYQRIAMYPLVLLLGIAAWRHDAGIRRYAAPLAAIGAAIAVYQMLIERFPSLEAGTCEVTNPCSIIWVETLGYLTLPTMALTGFALILALLVYAEAA
jgi:disulfide bond formation protein DsbB